MFLKRYDFNDSIPDPGGTGCWLSITALAQASTVIPESEAPQQIGQNATVEGVVTAVSTSKRGNTFINFGGVYPNQTVHRLDSSRHAARLRSIVTVASGKED